MVPLPVKSSLHSEDALFYGRKLVNFEVNHDKVVDLFSSVKKFAGVKMSAPILCLFHSKVKP